MWKLTSASGFEIDATIAELETRVVAVARLVRGIFDDGVDGRLLDDTRRVSAGTAEFGLQTAAGQGDGRRRHERQEDDDCTERRRTNDRGGTTSHRKYYFKKYNVR